LSENAAAASTIRSPTPVRILQSISVSPSRDQPASSLTDDRIEITQNESTIKGAEFSRSGEATSSSGDPRDRTAVGLSHSDREAVLSIALIRSCGSG
jgi:hypothetical protein